MMRPTPRIRLFSWSAACLGLAFGIAACGARSSLDDGSPASPVCPAVTIEEGAYFSCALLEDGRLKCWGQNDEGELGLGDAEHRGDEPGEMGSDRPAIDLGAGKKILAISAGDWHTCALLDGGSVKCWGRNDEGQLGCGDTNDRGDNPGEMGDDLPAVDLGAGRTAVAISARGRHSCALLDDGRLKCWGWNISGQLGSGDTNNRGDEPGEMGDHLPAIDLGAGKTAVTVAAGVYHTCALLDDSRLKCWGSNADGRLGLGGHEQQGDEPGEMGDHLPAVDLGAGKTAIMLSGAQHTCAILSDGDLKCWGLNAQGRLGLGDENSRGDEPGEMGDDLPAIDLGAGNAPVALDTGWRHTCVKLQNGRLKCWGHNEWGVLGRGDVTPRGDQPGQMGDDLPYVDLGTAPAVLGFSVDAGQTCALFAGGSVKCWGYNKYGQLGVGDTDNRGDAPGEMGDSLPFIEP